MQRKFGERLLSSPQLLDEPPPAYPAMASDASDSARTHARTHAHTLSPLPFLPSSRTPHLCSLLLSSLPARTLASDLPTSGTHLPPCHYVVISDNERVSATKPKLARLPPTKMGAKAVSPRNPPHCKHGGQP